MKISREWLQKHFEVQLPDAEKIAEALTFHAFEIESVDGDVLDVKITPNRGHDCLSYRGIAKEVAAILDVPMKKGDTSASALGPASRALEVTVEDTELCPRFTAAVVRGVKVAPSPEWLKTALERMGQRSINNVVDATNYVMFDSGQPLHAFDAGKLHQESGVWRLHVRHAKSGEKMLGLDDKEYVLDESMLAIADGHTKEAVSIAGIKGGKPTGIDESTTDIILEAANWNGPMIRKASQKLKLRTDASERFQQAIAPDLASVGLSQALERIVELAGGQIEGYIDVYPKIPPQRSISVDLTKINSVLGTALSAGEIADVLRRLGLPYTQANEGFSISVPKERLDLEIAEDLIEEVGRIIGYDKVIAAALPEGEVSTSVNPRFFAAEKIRQELLAQGYSEIFTSAFADTGERAVLNKVDSVRPLLRPSLIPGLEEALAKNVRNKDLLGVQKVKLFEIGTVWKGGGEVIMLGTIAEKEKAQERLIEPLEGERYEAYAISAAERFRPFSKYPSITRDIAMWTPAGTAPESVLDIIRTHAGTLLVRSSLFDRFEKGDRLSLAFRLVFQSFEKTLTDAQVNAVMDKVVDALKDKGFEIR